MDLMVVGVMVVGRGEVDEAFLPSTPAKMLNDIEHNSPPPILWILPPSMLTVQPSRYCRDSPKSRLNLSQDNECAAIG